MLICDEAQGWRLVNAKKSAEAIEYQVFCQGCTLRPAPPRPRGKWPPWAAPAPKIFNSAPPRPENYPGARIGANVPTSSKVFGSQKLLTSIFSTKGALRRHVTYNNHPNLT